MATVTKITAYFQLGTQFAEDNTPARVAGWSESWYHDGATDQARLAARPLIGNGLLALRTELLPKGGQIVAQRYQEITDGEVGPSVLDTFRFTNNAGLLTDLPSMCLYIRCVTAGKKNTKTFLMRGLPDDCVKRGEYAPGGPYKDALQAFIDNLANWQFRCADSGQPKVKIKTVSNLGLVTTTLNHGLNVGNIVQITRCKEDNTGKLFSGKFEVLAIPSATTYEIDPGELTETARNGFSQKYVVIYPTVDPNKTKPMRAGNRKVGRPFDLFHGRR